MTSYPNQKSTYYSQPDYTQPLLEITPDIREKLLSRLSLLYGEDEAKNCIDELERLSRSQTQFQRGETLICDRQFTLKQPKKPP